MTCIVAVRGPNSIVVAADRQSTWGGGRRSFGGRPKFEVFQIEDGPQFVLAGAGDPALYEYARSMEGFPALDPDGTVGEKFVGALVREVTAGCAELPLGPHEENELTGSMLIVSATGIYATATNFSERQSGPFHALGSGGDYALGYLAAVVGQPHSDLVVAADPRRAAIGAIHAACEFDAGCGLPNGEGPSVFELKLDTPVAAWGDEESTPA